MDNEHAALAQGGEQSAFGNEPSQIIVRAHAGAEDLDLTSGGDRVRFEDCAGLVEGGKCLRADVAGDQFESAARDAARDRRALIAQAYEPYLHRIFLCCNT